MQAVFYRKYGTADVLEVGVLPEPALTPDGVGIRVIAAGINPADAVIRRGDLRIFTGNKFPRIPGNDVAGIVDRVGTQVKRFKPGDAVYAMTPNTSGGACAEYVVVAADVVAPIPTPLTFAEAAAVPLASLTALQALRDKAGVQPGMHVLINGASGGVGTFAVQIANAMGAHVTAVCSGRNVDFVRDLGAERVIDYTRTDVTQGGAAYDVVFDAVGLYPFARWRAALRPKGVAVTVNPGLGNPIALLLSRLNSEGKRLKSLLVKPSGNDLEVISQWISAGIVRPVIERTFTVNEAADAHRAIESKRTRGKLAMVIDPAMAQAAFRADAVAV